MKNTRRAGVLLNLSLWLVKGRIERIEILAVQMLLCNAQGIAKALVVNDLTFTQITQRISDVGIIAQANQIVIGYPCLLLC